jgi:amino acid adenylation domain-containing protein
MLGHLKTLLENIAKNPDRSLSSLPILTYTERHRLLIEWNKTQVEYPQHHCLHHLFEAQVERTPDAVAVRFEEQDLTYRELNNKANQLARHLRKLGVEPETLVGVYMERSLEMVISLYGILKAGGAYVPLDPEYPPNRVAFMVKDTQAPVLLTQKRLETSLPEHEAKVICLDSSWETIASESTGNLNNTTTAENIAYVIYTSGSTGRPKGVMNYHRGICNRLLWMQDEYRLTGDDRVLQKTPFSFDVSVWEFFWPLLVGARLVVARPGGHKDSGYLVRVIVEQEITTLHFVPSMLQLFLEDMDVEKCRSLKRVICSGEALPYDLQNRFFARLGAELHNLYGPTEAAVDVSYWECQRESKLMTVPIGRPVANTQLYILDRHLDPVPIGVAGELHIGGVQVARGYLNRPKLTKEKFIPDPFNENPTARLYKTGDLARFLPDGDIEFLGRIDHQVKIRGNRIELGEIESVLGTHPSIKQAVVLAREDDPGEMRLVAYLVTSSHQKPDIPQLRSHLETTLPDFMIPSTFVTLEVMPLLTNGKVNRQALPKPSNKRPELGHAYVPPRDELERYLSEYWCNIIKLDRVGIHDHFFELGGNSLQAARFINRLQQDLGENIYIVSIFEAPTIAEYAKFLQTDYSSVIASKFNLKQLLENEKLPEQQFDLNEDMIDEKTIAKLQSCIFPLPSPGKEDKGPKNPPVIFILSPPRSGTTLLRVMLAGHPDLFSASELQLLGFNTLQERRTAYSGKFSLWLEGTIRTIMEIKDCDAEEATRIMEEFEKQDYTTKQFYRTIQDLLGDKILVDKSPSYVLDPNTLEKAERDFQDALYIHLVRHPYAMVRSFQSYHINQVLFLKAHSFSPRQLGELVWCISHKNASQFLQSIPEHRQFHLRFEDLITQPQAVMSKLCQTLEISYHMNLIKPYKDVEYKMTDGIYKESKPMGDTRFLDHGSINPEVAEAWKGVLDDNFLSDITWELAASLGYEIPSPIATRPDMQPTRREKPAARRRRELLEQRRIRGQRLRKKKKS